MFVSKRKEAARRIARAALCPLQQQGTQAGQAELSGHHTHLSCFACVHVSSLASCLACDAEEKRAEWLLPCLQMEPTPVLRTRGANLDTSSSGGGDGGVRSVGAALLILYSMEYSILRNKFIQSLSRSFSYAAARNHFLLVVPAWSFLRPSSVTFVAACHSPIAIPFSSKEKRPMIEAVHSVFA